MGRSSQARTFMSNFTDITIKRGLTAPKSPKLVFFNISLGYIFLSVFLPNLA